jgi:hypothetical protein
MLLPLACSSSVRGKVAACSWRLHLHAAALSGMSDRISSVQNVDGP